MHKPQTNEKELFFDGSIVKLLQFSLELGDGGQIHLGINIQKIREIVEPGQFDPLPSSYWPFFGVFDLRGTPIPLLALGHVFGAQLSAKDLASFVGKRTIICEFQRMLIGVVIDSTKKIITTKNSEIKSIPEVLDITQKKLFNGVLKTKDGFINLLDIELILDGLKVDLGPQHTVKEDHKFIGKTVLVVEDSRLFQKKLTGFFEKIGMKVYMAEDGEKGLEVLRSLNYQVDLVFTDIEMPLLNGIGMVKKIKEDPQGKKLPIIFNTSISNEGLIEDIRHNQLGEYIIKFDEKEILDTIEKVLN